MNKLETDILDFFKKRKEEKCLVVIANELSTLCKSPIKLNKAIKVLEAEGKIVKQNSGWSLKQ